MNQITSPLPITILSTTLSSATGIATPTLKFILGKKKKNYNLCPCIHSINECPLLWSTHFDVGDILIGDTGKILTFMGQKVSATFHTPTYLESTVCSHLSILEAVFILGPTYFPTTCSIHSQNFMDISFFFLLGLGEKQSL